MSSKRRWYQFAYTLSPDSTEAVFFRMMNSRIAGLRAIDCDEEAPYVEDRPRVRLDPGVPWLTSKMAPGELCHALRLVSLTPEIDWFLTIGDRASFVFALQREMTACLDIPDKTMWQFMADVADGKPLLNLFLGLDRMGIDSDEHYVDGLLSISGVRRFLMFTEPRPNECPMLHPDKGAIPPGIDWVIADVANKKSGLISLWAQSTWSAVPFWYTGKFPYKWIGGHRNEFPAAFRAPNGYIKTRPTKLDLLK